MANPMMQILGASRAAPLKQMLNSVRMAGNPQAMLEQMLRNNPNYSKAMELVRQNGGDAQRAFYNLANQYGVDPNEILNSLK